MTRPGDGGRRPRVPGWLLAALVAGCLATAGWMFWVDARLDDPAATKDAATETEREQADSVLDVPEDESGDDATERREDAGRDRLDAGQGTDDDDPASDEDDAEQPEPLPPVFQHLKGRTVALAAASVAVRGDSDRQVRIGGLRVPCAGAVDADRIEAELELLARIGQVLDRAGATVAMATPTATGAPCADVRARLLRDADFALVVRSGEEEPRALAGAPAADADRASRAASNRLALELAGALGVTGQQGADDADRAAAGAIDLAGGSAVAYVEPVAESDDTADEVALAIARAMALTLARADRG